MVMWNRPAKSMAGRRTGKYTYRRRMIIGHD
jgi:hypothetical protein